MFPRPGDIHGLSPTTAPFFLDERELRYVHVEEIQRVGDAAAAALGVCPKLVVLGRENMDSDQVEHRI